MFSFVQFSFCSIKQRLDTWRVNEWMDGLDEHTWGDDTVGRGATDPC